MLWLKQSEPIAFEVIHIMFLTSQPENLLQKKGEQLEVWAEVRYFKVSFVILFKFVKSEKCWWSKLKSTILGEASWTDLPTQWL